MRAGPQLGVDAYGVSGFTRSCAPATASAASLGHVRLQAVARDSRFARYCEDNTLADAPILNTNIYQF